MLAGLSTVSKCVTSPRLLPTRVGAPVAQPTVLDGLWAVPLAASFFFLRERCPPLVPEVKQIMVKYGYFVATCANLGI